MAVNMIKMLWGFIRHNVVQHNIRIWLFLSHVLMKNTYLSAKKAGSFIKSMHSIASGTCNTYLVDGIRSSNIVK